MKAGEYFIYNLLSMKCAKWKQNYKKPSKIFGHWENDEEEKEKKP